MVSETEKDLSKKHFFNHLTTIGQTYYLHWFDAMKYCGISFKAAFFFFIHAFWPDFFVNNGSNTIFELNDIIMEKYKNFKEKLESESKENKDKKENQKDENKDEIEVQVNL
jgi:hypothetical protein